MYRERTVGVVVPCFNEETQIAKVIDSMPGWIDKIYTVDDCSTDKTYACLREISKQHPRVKVLHHEVNRGVGAAIGTGYKAARDDGIGLTVVMAGDGQMDPDDLPILLDPLVDDKVDYCKGNRFLYYRGIQRIPRVRLFGNFVLSALTKLSSGYWNIADTQCGYTAVNLSALESIDLDNIYPRYGCPNDILTKLNIAHMRVGDVPVAPLYNVGEMSKMKITRIILPILRLLGRNFLDRLFQKYIVRSAHPLVLAYGFAALAFSLVGLLGFYLLGMTIASGVIPKAALMLTGFSLVAGLQLLISALEMDFNANKDVQVYLAIRHSQASLREQAAAKVEATEFLGAKAGRLTSPAPQQEPPPLA